MQRGTGRRGRGGRGRRRVAPVRRPSAWRTTACASVTLALLAGCVGAPPPAPPRADLADVSDLDDLDLPEVAATSVLREAQQVTVRIRSLGCEQLGLGSGFVLPGGIVVTNRHVVEEPLEVSLNTWDGRSLDAEVDGVAVDSDLAVLRLRSSEGLPEAELREDPVTEGEAIIAVGYPGGGPSTVTTGEVVGLVRGDVLGEPADVIRVDAEIRQGNSGGPLLDEEGRVVGVVFALEIGTGHGLAVPVETLLERLEGGGQMTRPTGAC
ncbi:trypsin-like peptidase domain-containing protein [Nitriliruptoraceae bacterium ZYF776]|nr:trypsin-like peptidase domain-containing protein [Profundirhabdus halotolerans]